MILGTSDDSTIRLWDANNGDMIQTLIGHYGPVNGAAFSPEGSLLASTSNDSVVGLWDVKEGEMLAQLRGHSGIVIRPAF